jgi:hypothetical protein
LLCGYTVEHMVHDYGVDLLLWTYTEEGELESESVKIQLKATDSLPLLQDSQTIAFSISHADLELWLREWMPVILVVYDARDEVAYWLYLQAYFQEQTGFDLAQVGQAMTVYLNRSDLIHQDAIRQFARYKARILDQLLGVRHDAS